MTWFKPFVVTFCISLCIGISGIVWHNSDPAESLDCILKPITASGKPLDFRRNNEFGNSDTIWRNSLFSEGRYFNPAKFIPVSEIASEANMQKYLGKIEPKLKGIVNVNGSLSAMIQVLPGKQPEYLISGGYVGDWRIISIESGSVNLDHPDGSKLTLKLEQTHLLNDGSNGQNNSDHSDIRRT